MVTSTSIMAFKELDLNKKQSLVYQSLKRLGVANNLMVSKDSGININCVCGRMYELRNKLKKVTFVKKDICPYTKKITQFWRVL